MQPAGWDAPINARMVFTAETGLGGETHDDR